MGLCIEHSTNRRPSYIEINIQIYINNIYLRGAGAQACVCEHDRLWVRYLLEEMKYLFLHSGVGKTQR